MQMLFAQRCETFIWIYMPRNHITRGLLHNANNDSFHVYLKMSWRRADVPAKCKRYPSSAAQRATENMPDVIKFISAIYFSDLIHFINHLSHIWFLCMRTESKQSSAARLQLWANPHANIRSSRDKTVRDSRSVACFPVHLKITPCSCPWMTEWAHFVCNWAPTRDWTMHRSDVSLKGPLTELPQLCYCIPS